MNQDPLKAVNWNQLNRINGGRRKRCRRERSGGRLNLDFSQAVDQDHAALIQVGEVLSKRYHGKDGSNTSIVTVYFSEPGAKNWAERVKQNLFGAALTSNGTGDLYVLLDDLTSAIEDVRKQKPALSGAIDRILKGANGMISRKFCKDYPLSRDATSRDHQRWLSPRAQQHQHGQGAALPR